MPKKIIQVPIDDILLSALDSQGKEMGRSRARLIREACVHYLAELESRKLDTVYQEGYRRIPEETGLAEAQAKLLGDLLGEESW